MDPNNVRVRILKRQLVEISPDASITVDDCEVSVFVEERINVLANEEPVRLKWKVDP